MGRPSKSDPQQYRVYGLERDLQGPLVSLTRKNVRRLCDQICDVYAVSRVRIKYKDLKGWAAECHPDGLIVFGIKETSTTVLTVVHELAHHIHNQLCPVLAFTLHQPHGAEFMGCYMHVLDRARVIPFVAMKALCRDRGVRYRDPGTTGSLRSLKRALG